METGDYLTIQESAMDGGSPRDPVHMKPEAQQPAVYETLQTETRDRTETSTRNKSRSNRIIIVILVITVIVLCSAVAGGLGWYFGSQNINPGRGKVLISRF